MLLACPQPYVNLAQIACLMNDIIICLQSGTTKVSLYISCDQCSNGNGLVPQLCLLFGQVACQCS
jgi:hypothetical protein